MASRSDIKVARKQMVKHTAAYISTAEMSGVLPSRFVEPSPEKNRLNVSALTVHTRFINWTPWSAPDELFALRTASLSAFRTSQ
eukprot:2965105-Pyramimonas_sp.AAC.1